MFGLLDETPREEGVEIRFETTVDRLVVDHERRRIVGVQATCDGVEINVRARNSVVITTSSPSYNEEMLREYALEYPDKGTPLRTYYSSIPMR